MKTNNIRKVAVEDIREIRLVGLDTHQTNSPGSGSTLPRRVETNPVAYQSVNPSTGELLRTFDEHTDQQMEEMLATAERTFREVWSRKSVRERAKVIGKAASNSVSICHLAGLNSP